MPSSRAAADQQVHDRARRSASQRAGRLVGEHDPRPGDQRRGPARRAAPARRTARRSGAAPARRAPAGRTTRRASRSAAARRTPLSSSGSAMLSAAVSSGTSWPNWNTNPNAVRRSSVRSVSPSGRAACPSNHTSPVSGVKMPARQCSSVDLPEPLGPMTARISPAATGRLAPLQRRRRAERRADVLASRKPCGWRARVREVIVTHHLRQGARAGPRSASIQRRSASRWNRPWSASSASTRLAGSLDLGQLPHALQVGRALGVEVGLGRPAEQQREHDLGEQHRLQMRLGLLPARPARIRTRSRRAS